MLLFVIVLGCLALLAYAWVGYPLILKLLAGTSRVVAAPPGPEPPPTVAILLSAHNEAAVIRARLENLAGLCYPAERVRIAVGVDGSSDPTAEIARAWAAGRPNVLVHEAPVQRGKMAMLQALVGLVAGQDPAPELLVFTDANTQFETDVLARLAAPFADPRVGGVCGRLVFHADPRARTDETGYWEWENVMKARESRLDSCLGANGAVYAVRRERFDRTLPDNVIVDDLVIGIKVREQGFRMVYAPAAQAHEEAPAAVGHEWDRRVRIGTGAFQALTLCRRCLSPRYGVFAWMFFSHKVLRWVTPELGLAAVIGACLLAARPTTGPGWCLGVLVAGGTVLLALVALAGATVGATRQGKLARLARRAWYFLAMQAALFVGFLRFWQGDLKGHWRRTPRPEMTQGA